MKVTDYRSNPKVYGPFYSDAFKCWRIQFYAHGATYEGCRESSILAERIEDAQTIAPYVKKIQAWQAWQRALTLVRKIIEKRKTIGWVYIAEAGKRLEGLHATKTRDDILYKR